MLFVFLFYRLCHHTPITDVWLPPEVDSDGVIYNRQVAAVLHSGVPQGYFGYNESTADFGRFGAWGPFLIYIYALPALLFGDSVNMMLWCNVLFYCVGLALFFSMARLRIWQCAAFCMGLICLWFPAAAVFSGNTEALHLALVMVLVGGTAALRREPARRWYLVVTVAAAALETICRPYALLFWAMPLAVLWKYKSRRRICFAAAAVSFALALLSITKLSAPYFANSMDLSAFTLLFRYLAPIGAVQYTLQHIAGFWADWWVLVKPLFQGGFTYVGQTTLGAALLLPITIGCIIYDYFHGRAIRLKVTALACSVLVLLALASFYTAATLPRHGMLLAVFLLAAVTVENTLPTAAVYIPIMAVLLLPRNFEQSSMSTYSAEMGEQLDTVCAALTESRDQNDSDDAWDNTLAYAYDDGVFHGYLYAVPSGMGIEFDFNTYIADDANTIYARYAMVAHSGAAEARLVADGWQVLVSTDDLIVYERTDTTQE